MNNEFSNIKIGLQNCQNYTLEGGNLQFTELIKNGKELKSGDPNKAGKITINCKNCKVELE